MDAPDDDFPRESRVEPVRGEATRVHTIAGIALIHLRIVRLTMNFVATSVEEEQARREAAWRDRPRPTGMENVETGTGLSRSAIKWFMRPIDAIASGSGDNAPLPAPAELIGQPDD